jgi:Flp pilus assembly secretin CpaC
MVHRVRHGESARRSYITPRDALAAALVIAGPPIGCVPITSGTGLPTPGDAELTCRCQEDAQVHVEVRFLVVEDHFLHDLRIDLDTVFEMTDTGPRNASYAPAPLTTDAATFVSATGPGPFLIDSLAPPADDPAEGLAPLGAILAASDVNRVLDALPQDAMLLSAPRVTAAFGQSTYTILGNESQFLSDLQHDFASALRSIDELINPVTLGPSLQLTPRVSDDGTILIDIRPSTGGVFHTPDAPGSRLIVRGSRFNTTIQLNDGQTILLGGVTDESGTTEEGTLPLLGNVPVAGRSFEDRLFVHDDSNLIVLITPTIVRDTEP